jgi:DNA transposase THAP9
MNILGCNLFVTNYDDIKTNFPHPSTGDNVSYILDAVHMEKLARNAMDAFDMQDRDGGTISFAYIRSLHELQTELGFRFDNKIRAKHIFFKRNIMKVNIAYETLSDSTAAAIEFLEKKGVPAMQGSAPTVLFIRTINFLFDILNSKSPHATNSKAALTRDNIESKRLYCIAAIEYLFALRINNKPLHAHPRRTFLLGFAAAIKSIFHVSASIFGRFPQYQTIETFQFSQDFLEIFFGIVRSRLGCNTNPSVQEFKWALRRILVRHQLQGNRLANVRPIQLTIGSVFSLMPPKKPQIDESFVGEPEKSSPFHRTVLAALLASPANNGFEQLTDSVIYYIGGWIVSRVIHKLDCGSCESALINSEKLGIGQHTEVQYFIYSSSL